MNIKRILQAHNFTTAEEAALDAHIKKTTAAIRAGWSEATRQTRATGLTQRELEEREGWSVPVVAVDETKC